MRMSRMTVPLAAAAMAMGVLALSPAVASTPPAASGLCAAGVGVGVGGGLHGTVVEQCDASHQEAFTPMAGMSRTESPPPAAFEALMVAISSPFAHRILIHNALISMIP